MERLSAGLTHAETLEPRRLLSSGYALAADTSFVPSPDGIYPSALVMDRNGNLFGTTERGGTWGDGTVFEIPNGTTTIETLVSLDGSSGVSPTSLTLDQNGDLFGTTADFDGEVGGTVFEIRAGSRTATLVATLGQGLIGYSPSGPLVYSNGNLYGSGTEQAETTQGDVFKLNVNAGTFTDLATFSGVRPNFPTGGLVSGPGGNLFGEMPAGGANDPASVFEISPNSGALTTLATFSPDEFPAGGLAVDSVGDVYGTSKVTTTGADDRIFEIPVRAAIQTVATFGPSGGGDVTTAMTVDAAGNLYGTTLSGGTDGKGSLFEVQRGTNTITTFASFDGANGVQPGVSLLLGPSGDLFGATAIGGASNDGTIFRISGTDLLTLASFTAVGASQPSSPLVSDPNGNLFGTTSAGGPTDDGTIFEVPRGSTSMTVLANFSTGIDGNKPQGNMVMDTSGDLFGTATGFSPGIVFELPHNSPSIITLATIDRLRPGLAIDSDGNLFGAMDAGPKLVGRVSNAGQALASIFEISRATAALTTMATFDRGDAVGDVSLDSAGDIFGTFSSARDSGAWKIFDIASGAHLINVLTELPRGGALPGPLSVDSSGNLFGTLKGIQFGRPDVVFELAHGARQIRVIASARASYGSGFAGPLAVNADGDVFGVTSGSVFEIPRSTGALSTLLNFGGVNGSSPIGVTLDASGNLVGTTSSGGTSGAGAFFELSPADVPPSGATQLVFSSVPSSPIAGEPFDPTVTVSVLDSAGQVVTTDGSTVTLSFFVGSTTTNLTATAVNGVATFPNLIIDQPGPVSLEARDGTLATDIYVIVAPALPLVARLGNATIPAGTVAGSKTNATLPLAITDTGKAFADKVQIDLYADTGSSLDGNEMLVESFSPRISLKPGGTLALSLPIRSLPVSLLAGTYHLVVKLTESFQIIDIAATIGTVRLTAPYVQPALSVGAVSPGTLTAGQSASVLVTITNNGNVAAGGIDLAFSPSSDGITPIPGMILDRIQSNVRIAPGHSQTLRLRFKVPSGLATGTYFPYVSCLLGGVTNAAAGPMHFNVAAN